METKIGEDGRAIRERHFSDHGSPHVHSISHNHEIDGSWEYPDLGKQINYFDETQTFEINKRLRDMGEGFASSIFDQYQYEPLGEFKFNMECGSEIEFTWQDRIFEIFSAIMKTPDGPVRKMNTEIYVNNMKETEMWVDPPDEILDYIIEGKHYRSDLTTTRF